MDKTTIIWIGWLVAALVLSPLLPGIINRVKAFFAGRRGPSVLQLYYDLFKLLRKERIYSATSGGVLPLAPVISLGAIISASLLVPYGGLRSPLGFTGDVILFFYLLGTARMATVLGALDTGSSFEGMGASREMQFSALTECAVFAVVAFIFMSVRAGIQEGASLTSGVHLTSVLLTAVAFFIVLLAENCRVPVDDPDTHLELTMIHEAMVLDYGGPDLALILYGASLKLWLFASFLIGLLLPAVSGAAAAGLFIVGIFAVTVLVGIMESCMARYRFLKVPQMLLGALGVSLLGIVFLIFFEGGL